MQRAFLGEILPERINSVLNTKESDISKSTIVYGDANVTWEYLLFPDSSVLIQDPDGRSILHLFLSPLFLFLYSVSTEGVNIRRKIFTIKFATKTHYS